MGGVCVGCWGWAGYIRLLPDEALKWGGLNHMIYVLRSASLAQSGVTVFTSPLSFI